MKVTVSAGKETSQARISLVGALLVFLAVSTTALALVISGGAYAPAPVGISDPGPLVVWGSVLLRVLTDIAAVTTIGFLIAAAFLDPSGKDGVLSPAGRKDVVRATKSAVVWMFLALAQTIFLLANVLSLSLTQTLNPTVISTYVNEVPATRALVATAIVALVIALGGYVTATTGVSAAWLALALITASLPALAGHGSGFGDHALALTAGVAHVIAATLWVGGVFVLILHALRKDIPIQRSLQRFSPIALTAIALLAVSGIANAYTRLNSASELFTTGYGQVVTMKVTLILALGIIGWLLRQRVIPQLNRLSRSVIFVRTALIELIIMVMAMSLGVALAASPYPRIETELPSYGESLLGYLYPEPPTFERIAFGFQLEPFFLVGSLVAASLYAVGYARLRARGDAWPIMRLVSWMAGIAVVIWCTNSGIALYSQVSVGLHMTQHMTLTMLGPIFLVMGAPATLALRALKPSSTNERGPREWVVWFLHSPINRVLTNPFYVFVVYVIGLYGLYLTPAFGWLMGSHVGHIIMQLHFVTAGYLFYWVLIGIDPRPRPLPYWGRIVLLLLSLGVHAFFAVILMMGTTPMAVEWYGIVRPDWVTDPLQDTLFGGQVAWGLSEIPALIVLIVIMVQWSRSDDREAVRKDRQADRDGDAELNAYNERLASMNKRSS
ncbi:MAG: cytochrome c oxidase assembly protein [Candidatus Nanopelagicales bacterium]